MGSQIPVVYPRVGGGTFIPGGHRHLRDGPVPLLAREQSLVVEGAIAGQLPFPVLGNSDNDRSINQTRVCRPGNRVHPSRAYRKNDQAWIQKNGSVVRRFAGHDRTRALRTAMVHLYQAGELSNPLSS